MKTLSDFGERHILSEVLPNYVQDSGDDCILIPNGTGYTVASTDPAPTPAAKVLCNDACPYWQGWLLVTINVSDVASMGAKPTSFLASLDLPSNYPIDSFEQLLSGIKDSCEANKITYAGGNIRESRDDDVTLVGTALGQIDGYAPLLRIGAKPNDSIYAVGKLGKFWSDYASFKLTDSINKDRSPIFSPVAQSVQMETLAKSGLVTAAMDISDGLMPSLLEIAQCNRLNAILDVNKLDGQWVNQLDSSEVFGSHKRVYLGWGDWCVLCAVAKRNDSKFTECCIDNGISMLNIGDFTEEKKDLPLLIRDEKTEIEAARLESERFAKDSWFSAGIQGYIDLLSDYPLP